MARGVATEPGELPEELWPVLDAAAGLTRGEAENAFALSLVRHGRLDPAPLWELKAKQLKSRRAAERCTATAPGFNALGGLDALKEFCRTALDNRHDRTPNPRACCCWGRRGRARARSLAPSATRSDGRRSASTSAG